MAPAARISFLTKLMEMTEGRTAEPMGENAPVFSSFVEWIRLCLVTVSMLGLFWHILLATADNRK